MMGRNRKGQVALEFLVYAGVFLLIAVAAYALTYFTQRGEISLRESQMFREFGYKFQYAGIVAYRGGPGFTYDLYFPPMVDGKPYDLVFMTYGRASNVKTVWNGSSAEFAYLYTIPLAEYVQGEGDCFKALPGASPGVSIDATKADGHLLFVNEGTNGEMPTIRIDCGGSG